MKLSHGEVLDRLTVLQIKRIMATDPGKLEFINEQLRDPEFAVTDSLLSELAILNTLIFLAVDEIAIEPDLEKCGTLGKRIQALNLKRSTCKNALNTGDGYQDIKI